MPTVTVVIPVLNDEAMLAHCLAAIQHQTRQPDAVIVVDNGCTDGSMRLAAASGATIVSEPRRGILPATARGFDAAETDILARLDADSRPHPDWLARTLAHFESEPDLDAVTGTGEFYGGARTARTLGRHLYLGGYFLWMGMLLGNPPLYGSNFALRMEAWKWARDRIHRTDPRIHDDQEISFHLPEDVWVRFDPTLTMPVSARPFATVAQTARRVGWGFRTIWVNAREESLWARRRRVLAHRRAREAGR